MRGDSGVAGEGGVVGVPKFHSCFCEVLKPAEGQQKTKRCR